MKLPWWLRRLLPDTRRAHAAAAAEMAWAWTLYLEGQPLEALRAFESLLAARLSPSQAVATHLGMGLCWEAAGDIEQACQVYDACLDLRPSEVVMEHLAAHLIRCREALARRQERSTARDPAWPEGRSG